MRQGYTVPRPYIQWCALDAFIAQCKSACGVLEPTRNSKAYNIGIYTAVNNAKARTWNGMTTKEWRLSVVFAYLIDCRLFPSPDGEQICQQDGE